MSKKDKTYYLNLDKNQLADKGKTKLQYEENCKEAAKRYSESKKLENSFKTSKGTISNISKKILAGTIVFALSTTSLVGCSTQLQYKKDKNGELVCVTKVSHRYVEDYKVVIFEIDGKQSIYITEIIRNKDIGGKDPYHEKYYNIFGNQLIYDSFNDDSNLKIIEEEYLTGYLVTYDKVKSEYSEDDLKEVLELIKNDYEKEKDKKLIKEK